MANGYDPEPVFRHFYGSTCETIANTLHVSLHTVRKWKCGQTRIRSSVADRIALQLGKHPVNMWPTWPEEQR